MPTTSKRVYTQEEKDTLALIASYKWKNGFVCRYDDCGNERFYKGTIPYSRRCTVCKNIESPTSNTAFDRLRMPVSSALEIINLLLKNDQRINITRLYGQLKAMGSPTDPKTVYSFCLKVFERMEQPKVRYDNTCIFIQNKSNIFSKGTVKGKTLYRAWYGTNIRKTILDSTGDPTLVSAFYFLKLNPMTRTPEQLKCNRAAPVDGLKMAKELAEEYWKFYPGAHKDSYCRDSKIQLYLNYMVFMKNRESFDTLMHSLMKPRR